MWKNMREVINLSLKDESLRILENEFVFFVRKKLKENRIVF